MGPCLGRDALPARRRDGGVSGPKEVPTDIRLVDLHHDVAFNMVPKSPYLPDECSTSNSLNTLEARNRTLHAHLSPSPPSQHNTLIMSWNPPRLTWLITGASSGFGLALTRTALSAGHLVIATSRNPSRNPALVAEIEAAGGQFLALDVDDPHSGGLVDRLEQQGTAVDVLVNNAGWSIHGPAESFAEDEVRRQMETVFFGPYRLIRAVVPHMRARRRGMILNIGSGAGVNGRESMGIYAGSKAALDGTIASTSFATRNLIFCRTDEADGQRAGAVQYPHSDRPTWGV